MEPGPEYHVDPPANPAAYPAAPAELPDLGARPEQLLAAEYRAWDGRSYELRCPACQHPLFLSYIAWRAALGWPKQDRFLDPVGYVGCRQTACPSAGRRIYLEPQARYERRRNTVLQRSLGGMSLPRVDRRKRTP